MISSHISHTDSDPGSDKRTKIWTVQREDGTTRRHPIYAGICITSMLDNPHADGPRLDRTDIMVPIRDGKPEWPAHLQPPAWFDAAAAAILGGAQ